LKERGDSRPTILSRQEAYLLLHRQLRDESRYVGIKETLVHVRVVRGDIVHAIARQRRQVRLVLELMCHVADLKSIALLNECESERE
jgi:hypothetical protein